MIAPGIKPCRSIFVQQLLSQRRITGHGVGEIVAPGDGGGAFGPQGIVGQRGQADGPCPGDRDKIS